MDNIVFVFGFGTMVYFYVTLFLECIFYSSFIQVCEIARYLLSPLYHRKEDVKWNIIGRLLFTSNFNSQQFSHLKQRELQYDINSLPQITLRNSITFGNITVPMFAWTIQLKRLILPFVVKAFIPTAVLVMVSWISFLITPECVPGRAGLLVTLLLILTKMYVHELDTSPSVQGITPLLIWNQICIIMIILTLLEYAGILYVMRFCTPTQYIERIRVLNVDANTKDCGLMQKNTKTKTKQIDDDQNHKKNKETRFKFDDMVLCLHKAQMADHYSLIIVPSSFCVVTFIYWIYFPLTN